MIARMTVGRTWVGLGAGALLMLAAGCLAPPISEGSFQGADGRPVKVIGTVAQFDAGVLGAARPQVVVFYSPSCPHCGGVIRKLPEVVAMNPAADFSVVNVYQLPDLGARHEVTGVPTTICFRGGREAARVTGNRSAESFSKWLVKHGVR